MKTLHQHLAELDKTTLQAVAQMQGLDMPAGAPPLGSDDLAAAMLEIEQAREVWADLSNEARAALRALITADNRLPVPAFERNYGQIRRFGPGRLQQERPWASPANIAEQLWYRGLIARSFVDTADGLVEYVHIPTDLLFLLPLGVIRLPALAPAPCLAPDHVRTHGQQFLDDLVTVLIHVHNQRVWLTDRGHWRMQDLQPLAAQWLQPPADSERPLAPGRRPALLLHCAHQLGLLHRRGRRLSLHAATAWPWLQHDRNQQMRALVQAWRDSADWDDLCLTPGLVCDEGNWRHDNRQIRQAALAFLGHIQAGEWYDWSDFIALVHARQPDFLRLDGNYHTWYIRNEQGEYLKGFTHWHDIEARVLHYLWSGPLHWLGMIDWAEDEARWSLTHAGAASLGLAEIGLPAPPPELVVSDDFRVLIPTGARVGDRFQVARFSDWEASWPGYRYRISQRALRRAACAGITPAQVLDFLDRAAAGKIPANVRKALAAFSA